MTKIDKLENTIKNTYGIDSVVLDSTDMHAIIRIVKNGTTEYVVIRHNFEMVFRGTYFAPIGQTVEQARKHAWDKYKKTI
ncbi:hypothetical protein [Mammaliicoccus sciuri]|uniref:hypothetical protein n=1 Tax=Mammaliicoccus sciuri TaxID=1296 RepID=UPI002B258ECE|nr:hypothetical protein [Mammaliicoccus sciuri]WQK75168.1 hypothetical protein P3U33_05420 [Mammaliicoccus sciuri]